MSNPPDAAGAAETDAPNPPPPGPIDPADAFSLTSRDGTQLYAEWFPVEQPRGAALVIHGYAEHCGRYRELAHVLSRAGVAALTYDMRGHGRAEGQRGHIDSIRDYLDDMDAAYRALNARLPDGDDAPPRFVIGHSNGGLIALRALADPLRKPAGVQFAVLSSPFLGLAMRVSPVRTLIGRVASRLLPTLSMPNELPIPHLTSDPDKQAERKLDTLCHDVAGARWFEETRRAQRYALEHAQRIDVPTLWLIGGGDRIVDPAASRAVHARLRAPSAYHFLAGLEHEVFNERDRPRVFALLTAYLDAHLNQLNNQ